MPKRPHQHLYPLMDTLITQAAAACQQHCAITCQKGCAHCCHLLVEVSWEEAVELASWVKKQASSARKIIIEKIKANAKQARELFAKRKSSQVFTQPVSDGDLEIPEAVFDEYFYSHPRPCPFLHNNLCSVYSHRPSCCRLHMVTSPVELCMRETADHQIPSESVEVPDELETLKQELEPILINLIQDGRWGHLGIMVEAALQELGVALNTEEDS